MTLGRNATAALISLSFHATTGVGLDRLDSFGRIADLHFQNASDTTLFRGEYTHDPAGNRIAARITQAATPTSDGDNDRSQLNTYDPLNRLIATEVGELNSSGDGIVSGTLFRSDAWGYDLLGNWSGRPDETPAIPGRASAGNLDGHDFPWEIDGADSNADTLDHTDTVDLRNQIETQSVVDDGAPVTPTAFEYDEAGNLRSDGNYFYQYDAWNRLIQVNTAVPNASGHHDPGDLLKHYAYDPMGRLVRIQSPYPDIGSEYIRTERLYYDGIRRIQEVVLDPVVPLGGAEASSDPGLQALAEQSGGPESGLDGSATPALLEEGQSNPEGQQNPPPQVLTYLAREYLWGPGDSPWGSGLDELLIQWDDDRNPWYALLDAGGDVVALCDKDASDYARVAAQWTFDPYGHVLTADEIHPFPHLHCGHKGLFLDRLDVPVIKVENEAAVENPRLYPRAAARYYARNRTYAPELGRWIQMDPNGSASILLESGAHGGRQSHPSTPVVSIESQHGDGANLAQYLRSNTSTACDPIGLYMWGDWSDTLAKGGEVFALAYAVQEVHRFVTDEAIDWATDWTRVDDEISDLSAIANAFSADIDDDVLAAAGPYAPAIAAVSGSTFRIGKAVFKSYGFSAKLQRRFSTWFGRGPRNVAVYIGYSARGKAKYVGISNDINRREIEHGFKLRRFTPDMARNQARAIENEVKRANPHFVNVNDPVAADHRFAQWASDWARKEIARLGKRIKF